MVQDKQNCHRILADFRQQRVDFRRFFFLGESMNSAVPCNFQKTRWLIQNSANMLNFEFASFNMCSVHTQICSIISCCLLLFSKDFVWMYFTLKLKTCLRILVTMTCWKIWMFISEHLNDAPERNSCTSIDLRADLHCFSIYGIFYMHLSFPQLQETYSR